LARDDSDGGQIEALRQMLEAGSEAADVAVGPLPAPVAWDLGPSRSFDGWGSRLDDDTAELPFVIRDVSEPPRDSYPRPEALSVAALPSRIRHVWLSDPMAEGRPDVLSKLSERRLEIAALLALSVGTLLASAAGFTLGLALVTLSRFWDLRDKLLTVLVLPGMTVFGGVVLSWLRATRIHPVADISLRLDRAMDTFVMTLAALPLLVGWLAAAYLGYLVVRDSPR
jgi:hypothetical protein